MLKDPEYKIKFLKKTIRAESSSGTSSKTRDDFEEVESSITAFMHDFLVFAKSKDCLPHSHSAGIQNFAWKEVNRKLVSTYE